MPTPKRHLELWAGTFHLATWDGNALTINAGYAWDGMTCWEDSAANLLASLFHDFFYQIGILLTRKQADQGMLHLLRLKNYHSPYLCYLAVRALGWKYYASNYPRTKPIPTQ